jgi:hypothetical protein
MGQSIDRMRYHTDAAYRVSVQSRNAEERLRRAMEQLGISRAAALQRQVERHYATADEPGNRAGPWCPLRPNRLSTDADFERYIELKKLGSSRPY